MSGGGGVQGADQLARSLDAAARELADLAAADDVVGDLLASAVVAEAPKRTGYMASTVQHVGSVVTIGAPYAVFVNARTGFAVRPLEQQQTKITDLYARAVAEVVAGIKGA